MPEGSGSMACTRCTHAHCILIKRTNLTFRSTRMYSLRLVCLLDYIVRWALSFITATHSTKDETPPYLPCSWTPSLVKTKFHHRWKQKTEVWSLLRENPGENYVYTKIHTYISSLCHPKVRPIGRITHHFFCIISIRIRGKVSPLFHSKRKYYKSRTLTKPCLKRLPCRCTEQVLVHIPRGCLRRPLKRMHAV